MKHEIPVHIMDESKEIVWWNKDKVNKQSETESPQHVSDGNVISYTTDWKIWSIVVLLVILTAFIAWYFMRDHWLQDGIDSINENNKSNVVSQRIIDRETIAITKRNSDNDKTREKLQKVYQVTVR